MARSIEEKVEEYFKSEFDSLGIRHYGKTALKGKNFSKILKNKSKTVICGI